MSNSNTNLQTQSSNALHNAIIEAGSKDRPPMLAPGNYVQWKSRIKRYIDTKPNSELIHYCLQNPPYTYQWAEKTVPVAEGIDNDIYSTVDACLNACEMWKAIERLKQGESINVQDLETNLYWEFGKFTSRDGESLESYTQSMLLGLGKNVGALVVQKSVISVLLLQGILGQVSKGSQKPKPSKGCSLSQVGKACIVKQEERCSLNAEQADWNDILMMSL
ncbi:hypothetical protein Tco_1516020 [Tanacetum coccineum]